MYQGKNNRSIGHAESITISVQLGIQEEIQSNSNRFTANNLYSVRAHILYLSTAMKI